MSKSLTVLKKSQSVAACCLLFAAVVFLNLICPVQSELARRTEKAQDNNSDRFDMLVRDDFFAGMMGDRARLDRGMDICERVLAKTPNTPKHLFGMAAASSRVHHRLIEQALPPPGTSFGDRASLR
jgi:hypothetical protein